MLLLYPPSNANTTFFSYCAKSMSMFVESWKSFYKHRWNPTANLAYAYLLLIIERKTGHEFPTMIHKVIRV